MPRCSPIPSARRTTASPCRPDKGAPARDPQHLEPGPEDVLYCVRCGFAITRNDLRLAVNGQHRHRRVNPAGITFHFGCFADAPGARPVGAAQREASWFNATTWRVALCGQCATHLGWLFQPLHGAQGIFFGLILDRLTLREL